MQIYQSNTNKQIQTRRESFNVQSALSSINDAKLPGNPTVASLEFIIPVTNVKLFRPIFAVNLFRNRVIRTSCGRFDFFKKKPANSYSNGTNDKNARFKDFRTYIFKLILMKNLRFCEHTPPEVFLNL